MGRGRPTRIQTHPERVMTFNTETNELSSFVVPEPESEPELEPEVASLLPRTAAVERGSFLVKF